jgi:L-gulono-1,4-lactone dehydrogenase
MALQLRAKYASRTRWKNHTGNQGVDPLRRYAPTTLEELVDIVNEAEALGVTVRAVGSGHSWSDVALTAGFLVETHGLNKVLDLEEDLLRERLDDTPLVQVEAGIRLRELNQRLDESRLALSNMGGYDAQTLAGVISTSTHGSGIGFGPIADSVRSLDLVASGGNLYRIEPKNGPTDEAAYRERYPERQLKQDDPWFRAAVVGMGCMGIIYSAIIAVEARHWLKEARCLSTWTEVKAELERGDVLRAKRHYEVLLNPYRRNGDNRCLITTRTKVPEPQGGPSSSRRRNLLPEIAAALPFTGNVLDFVGGLRPSLTPVLLDRALAAIVDEEYTDLSYKVLNIGTANLVPAYSAEIGIPIDERRLHLRAVEQIIDLAARWREVGGIYHTSPISLRFVKESPAYMSMMNGHDTMMIELIQMTHTEGGFELLAAYEDALYALEGRPHWGQVNTLTGSHDFLAKMYPSYPAWQEIHRQLNQSRVFDSPFSKRVGISTPPFGEA